jgi:putative ABC transport system substrate-binding protein
MRTFVCVLLVLAMLGSSSAIGQQATAVPHIGFLRAETPDAFLDAFREGLRDLGYVDGKNVIVDARWANGYFDKLPALANELVRMKVKVIVTASTPAALAAKQATSTIPIVIAASGDPVASGLVATLARPGGNITGQTVMMGEVAVKRLELLKEAVPGLSRVAVLWSALNPVYGPILKDMEHAAARINVQVKVFPVRSPDEIPSALALVKSSHCDGLYVFEDAVFRGSTAVMDFAASARLPAVYGGSEFVAKGGMMSYAPDIPEVFRRAALFLDKILRGAKPGELPIEQPTKFELAVNLKTAKALGITIPRLILVRADKVVQ